MSIFLTMNHELTTDFCISSLRKIIFNETKDDTITLEHFNNYLFPLSFLKLDELTEYLYNRCNMHEYDNKTTTTSGYNEDETSFVSVRTTTNNCSSSR